MKTQIQKRAALGKKIVLQDGEYCAFSEDGETNLGCFATKEEAEERLEQVERFKAAAEDGGTHVHALDRGEKTTANDGAHSHLFELVDGTLVETTVDGAHIHTLHDSADAEVFDGLHTHILNLPDGTTLVTESESSYHWHQLQLNDTAEDGAHSHMLDLPGQGSIRSLSPGELWERQHADQEKAGEPDRPVHIYRRVTDGNVSTELIIAGDKIVSIDTAKQGGASPTGLDIRRTYSIDGDRFTKSLCIPSKADFRFPSDDIEGVAVPVDKGIVELGLRHTDFFEYFISKSDRTNGVLLVAKGKDGEWAGWLNTEALLPTVLTATAVRKKWMTTDGTSGLPFALESVVPDDLRYWELEKSEDALAVRDALVESRFFTEDNIRIVNGGLNRVVHKMYLYQKETSKKAADKKRTAYSKRNLPDIMAPITGTRTVATTVLPADAPATWGAWVKDCAKIASSSETILHVVQPVCETEDGAVISTEIAKLSQEFVVALVDTPENRAELHKLGAPFKLRYGDQRWIYATSFPVAKRADVDWIKTAETAADLGLPDRVIKTIMPDGDVEERFVLGIVLEPEVIDAQNDIYSAGEVRSSAHKFMENFQNMGLMHQALVNNGVRILESFIAPIDMTVGDIDVVKGTWLLAVRVMDDGLWKAVKEGDLTGFSIGGSAIRVPD